MNFSANIIFLLDFVQLWMQYNDDIFFALSEIISFVESCAINSFLDMWSMCTLAFSDVA